MFWSGSLTTRRHRQSPAILLLLLGSLFACSRLFAGDLLRLEVTDLKGVYRIEVEMVVHAPAEEVWRVLTDYRHIYRLNTTIIESEILPAPSEKVTRVRTLMNDCVLVFCFELERVEDVQETDTGRLQARVVRELSNIRSGTALWHIEAAGANSHISYRGTIEPGFDVFPIIGNYLVRKRLRDMTLLTLGRIEGISRINAGLDAKPETGAMVSATP